MRSLNADASPSYLDLFYLQNKGNKLTSVWETALHCFLVIFALTKAWHCNGPLVSGLNDLKVITAFYVCTLCVCLLFVCFHIKSRRRLQVAPWSVQSPQLRISERTVFGRRRKVLSDFIDLVTKATRLPVSPAHPLLLHRLVCTQYAAFISFPAFANMDHWC